MLTLPMALPVLASRTLPQQSANPRIPSSPPKPSSPSPFWCWASRLVLFGFKAYKWVVVLNCIVRWDSGSADCSASGHPQIATVAAVIGALVLSAASPGRS